MASIEMIEGESVRVKCRLKYKKAEVAMLPDNAYKKVRLWHDNLNVFGLEGDISPKEIEVTRDDQDVEFVYSLRRKHPNVGELRVYLVYFSESPSREGGRHLLGTIVIKPKPG
jgi:hypothetical protein